MLPRHIDDEKSSSETVLRTFKKYGNFFDYIAILRNTFTSREDAVYAVIKNRFEGRGGIGVQKAFLDDFFDPDDFSGVKINGLLLTLFFKRPKKFLIRARLRRTDLTLKST